MDKQEVVINDRRTNKQFVVILTKEEIQKFEKDTNAFIDYCKEKKLGPYKPVEKTIFNEEEYLEKVMADPTDEYKKKKLDACSSSQIHHIEDENDSLAVTGNFYPYFSFYIIINNKHSNIDEKAVWTDDGTKLLISMVNEYRPLVGKSMLLKTKRKMWEKISKEFEQNGYGISSTQAENKFKSLERGYKKKICHNSKTGRDRAKCQFEE